MTDTDDAQGTGANDEIASVTAAASQATQNRRVLLTLARITADFAGHRLRKGQIDAADGIFIRARQFAQQAVALPTETEVAHGEDDSISLDALIVRAIALNVAVLSSQNDPDVPAIASHALSMFEKLEPTPPRFGCAICNNLGYGFLANQHFDQAMLLFERGVALCENIPDQGERRIVLVQSLANIATCAAGAGDEDKKNQVLDRLLITLLELSEGATLDELQRGVSVAGQFVAHRRLDDAVKCYSRIVEILDARLQVPGDLEMAVLQPLLHSLDMLVRLYRGLNQEVAADTVLTRLVEIAQTTGFAAPVLLESGVIGQALFGLEGSESGPTGAVVDKQPAQAPDAVIDPDSDFLKNWDTGNRKRN